MLKRFSVEGYRGFGRAAKINFADTDESDSRFVADELMNKAVIYGRSASGKTNLGLALFDIVGVLTDRVNGGTAEDSGSFTYEFAKNDDLIVYSYAKKSARLVSESLEVNGDTIFDFDYVSGKRDASGIELVYAGGPLKLDKVDGSASLLRLLGHNTAQEDDSPVSYVLGFAERMLYISESERLGFTDAKRSPEQMIMDRKTVKEFEGFLNDYLGTGIQLDTDVFLNKMVQCTANGRTVLRMSPSVRTLALYFCWRRSFDDASFIYIDDMFQTLDSDISDRLFDDVLCSKAQTVITTHDDELSRRIGDAYTLILKDGVIVKKGSSVKSQPTIFTEPVTKEAVDPEPVETEAEPAIDEPEVIQETEEPEVANDAPETSQETEEPKAAEDVPEGTKKVLYIVKDGCDEFELMGNVWMKFDKDGDYDVYIYKIELRRLTELLFDGGKMKDADLLETLISSEKSEGPRSQLEHGPYDAVYIMYDFDASIDESVMVQMCERFNDTSKGKLYINYPTIESYRHIMSSDDEGFRDRTADLSRIHAYKKSVDRVSMRKLKILPKCSKEVFRELIKMHMMKLNYIVNGDYSMPDREWFMNDAPKDLLEMQYQWGRDYGSVFVLNTGLFNIVDAMPDEFFQ